MTKKTAPRQASNPLALPGWAGADLLQLSLDSAQLWADSMAVIVLRTDALLARRPGSGHEAVRMVTEKVEAQFELAHTLTFAPGNPLKTSVDHYGRRVAANRKRLEAKRRGK